MTTYYAQKYKGAIDNNNEGSTVDYFKLVADQIEVNDGVRHNGVLTVNAWDRDTPIAESQKTNINLSTSAFHITQIDNGVLSGEYKLEVMLQNESDLTPIFNAEELYKTIPESYRDETVKGLLYTDLGFKKDTEGKYPSTVDLDPHRCLKIFIGFKHAVELIKTMKVFCEINGTRRETHYFSNECTRENYLYNVLKPLDCKQHQYAHTIWDNVAEYDDAICGTYLNVADMFDASGTPKQVLVEFQFNIPVSDIFAFQAFGAYPNFCLGNLILQLEHHPLALVWAPVPIDAVMEKEQISQGKAFEFESKRLENRGYTKDEAFYKATREFTQLGEAAYIPCQREISHNGTSVQEQGKNEPTITKPTEIKVKGWRCGKFRLVQRTNASIEKKFQSFISGYNITEAAKNQIASIFSKPVPIPSQQVEVKQMSVPPNVQSINGAVQQGLSNVSSLVIMFPHEVSDITVYKNPMITNFVLITDNFRYPDHSMSTVGQAGYALSMIACDLNDNVQVTKSFQDSFCCERNKNDESKSRKENMCRDATDFLLPIPTEKLHGGNCYDGICTTSTSNIQIQGTYKYNTTTNGVSNNTYLHPSGNPNDYVSRPIEIWIVKDSYWTWDTQNGVNFFSQKAPPGSQTTESEQYDRTSDRNTRALGRSSFNF